MKLITLAMVGVLAAGCADNDAQVLNEQRAERDADTINAVQQGWLTKDQSDARLVADHQMDAAQDAEKAEAHKRAVINALLAISGSAPQPSFQPTYSYSQPSTPAPISPMPSLPTYMPNYLPAAAPQQTYVPYSGVSQLMPGITSSGTTR